MFLDYNVVLSVLLFCDTFKEENNCYFLFSRVKPPYFVFVVIAWFFFMMSVLMLIDVVSVDVVDMH